MLCVIDEFTREALTIRVKRRLNSTDVLETLADLLILRQPPDYIRSDNGPEFIAKTLREWIAAVGSKTAYIEPGSPWDGYCESFNSKLRDELLNGEIFFGLAEAQALIEAWRRHYNHLRPHSPSTTDRRRQRQSSLAVAPSRHGRARQLLEARARPLEP